MISKQNQNHDNIQKREREKKKSGVDNNQIIILNFFQIYNKKMRNQESELKLNFLSSFSLKNKIIFNRINNFEKNNILYILFVENKKASFLLFPFAFILFLFLLIAPKLKRI